MQISKLAALFFCLLAVAGTCRADCLLTQTTAGTTPVVVLANEFLEATFVPSQGGECTDFKLKRGNNGVSDIPATWFDDRDSSEAPADQAYSGQPYTVTVLQNTPACISVAFERRGSGDDTFLVIRKVVTLREGERMLSVDYSIKNLTESMARKSFAFWMHNTVNLPGGAFYLATSGGISGLSGAGDTTTDSPRGWTSFIAPNSQSGIAFVVDYKDLDKFYNWSTTDRSSIEWHYLPQDISNGSSFDTSIKVVPFVGTTGLDNADAMAACSWTMQAPALGAPSSDTLTLSPTRAETLSVEIRLRHVTETNSTVLLSQQVDCVPQTPVHLPVAAPALAPGRYVLETKLTGPDGVSDEFERTLVVGHPSDSEAYIYAPQESKPAQAVVRHSAQYTISQDFVTPHVPWFEPYSQGKIKTLFIMPWQQERNVVELAQHLSLDYHVPLLSSYGDIYFSGAIPPLDGTFAEKDSAFWDDCAADLAKNQQYDAVVLLLPWKQIPSRVQTLLLQMAGKGVGLLFSDKNYDAHDTLGLLLASAVSSRTVKAPEGNFELATATVTEPATAPDAPGLAGVPTRLCLFQGNITSYPFARSLLWVSNHAPQLDATINWPANSPLTRDSVNQGGCPLEVKGGAAAVQVTAETVISQHGEPVFTHDYPLEIAPGDFSKSLPLPLLPSGTYECQVMLKSQDKVLTCAYNPLKVTDPVGIDAVKVPSPNTPLGAPVQGTLVFHNASPETAQRQYTVKLVDDYGRTLDQASGACLIPAGGQTPGTASVDFSLIDANPVAILHTVIASLKDGDNVVETQQCPVSYPDLAYASDDYESFTWPDGGNFPTVGRKYANTVLHDKVGFNLQMCRDSETLSPAFPKGFFFGGMGPQYNDWQTATTRASRKFSLTDPDVHDALVKNFKDLGHSGASYGVFGFDAADEPSLSHWEVPSELDFSKSSLAGFAIWIKTKYPTLEALNAEWGTTFATWDDVSPMIESEVKDRPNLAPWNDFRDYMEDEWTNILRDMRNAALKENPKAHFGVCGVQDGNPYSGFDMWKIHDFCDMVMPYTNSAVLRSFNPNGRYGKYTGYRIPPDAQIKESWANFFDDQSIFAYFLGTYPVNPDLTLSPTYADPVHALLTTFQGGIGKLFLDVPRQNDRIAIHYSQSSIRANYMLKYHEKCVPDLLALYRNDRLDNEDLFHNMGYDTSYISYAQVEDGLLTPANYRVFVLPMSTALSTKEVAAIRQYVSDGGILIGDCLTGLYDDHGKPNTGGSLDDLFGIVRKQDDHDRLAFTSAAVPGVPGQLLMLREAGISGDTAQAEWKVTPGAAGATGGDLVYHRTLGKGQTYYLGFLPGPKVRQMASAVWPDYERKAPQDAVIAGLYRALLSEGGVPPAPIAVTTPDGKPALCQVLRHQAPGDPNLFFGLLQRPGLPASAAPLKVTLPAPTNVYNLLTGAYLGHVSTFPVTLQPGIGQLFAALPGKVTGLGTTVAATVTPGHAVTAAFAIQTDGGSAGTHVLRLTATQPDGSSAEFLTSNLLAPDGRCSTVLPFALDAAAGTWTFLVKDVCSGVQATFKVGVGK